MGMSKVDQEVLDLWNDSVIIDKSQHYQLPISRKQNVYVPNNYEVAGSRLGSLKKSLVKKRFVQQVCL